MKMKLMKSSDPWFPNVFDEFFNSPFFSGITDDYKKLGCNIPAVNIHEAPDEFLFEMAAPGLKKEDFNINLENDNLIISCNREPESKDENNYTKREFNFCQFH
jgi:HSP20 family protein